VPHICLQLADVGLAPNPTTLDKKTDVIPSAAMDRSLRSVLCALNAHMYLFRTRLSTEN